MSWTDDALCAQIGDLLLFYPEQGDWRTAQVAKAVCANCPVRAECLEDALARKDPHGIWGGLSKPERERVARARRAA